MTARTGANIPAAIREFRAAGWSVAEIASDLGLHPSTIYRWQAGTRRPNSKNFAALVETVDAFYALENGRRRPRPLVLMHLQAAHTALEDPAERAAFEARMKAKHEAIVARRQQPNSVTYQVDPFAVVSQDKDLALVEGIF